VHNHDICNPVRFAVDITLSNNTDLAERLSAICGTDIQSCRITLESYFGSFRADVWLNDQKVWSADIAEGDIELHKDSEIVKKLFLGWDEVDDSDLDLSFRAGELDFDLGWNEYKFEHEYCGNDCHHRDVMDSLTSDPQIYTIGAIPIRALIQALSTQLRSIGPLRKIPDRNQNLDNVSRRRWYNGLSAWKELEIILAGKSPYNSVHVQLDDDDPPAKYPGDKEEALAEISRLKLGYEFGLKKFGSFEFPVSGEPTSIEPEKKLLLEAVKNNSYDIIQKLCLIDKKTRVEVRTCDVGTGVSQALPIAVGAFAEGCTLMTVEQPELHLHPRLQCDLADVFVANVHRHADRKFIIETHSEHLILRLLRRIRETSAGGLDNSSLALTPDDVGVLYVEDAKDGVRIQELRIDENGQFIDEWPGGFFEEDFDEIIGGL
jgi:hypothetical protein